MRAWPLVGPHSQVLRQEVQEGPRAPGLGGTQAGFGREACPCLRVRVLAVVSSAWLSSSAL